MLNRSRWMLRLSVLFLLVCLLLVPACVRLSRQRVSVSYDAAGDTLRVLIFYDGVHDSGDQNKGTDQLPEFAANGDIMLGDWPFHIQTANIKAAGIDESKPEAVRRLALAVIKNYRSRPLGHYTDASGRIGAAQAITLTEASKLIELVNEAINEAILKEGMGDGPSELQRTIRLWVAAAQKKHRWLRLNGQSLEIELPVSEPEWAVVRADILTRAMDQLKNRSKADHRHIAQMLTSAPLSLMQSRGKLTLRLGDPDGPFTARAAIRDEAPQNLVETVKAVAPVDLDAALADALMQPAAPKDGDAALAWALEWGPPEQAATALVRAATGPDAARAGKAAARLAQWARDWNQEHGKPEMPKPPEPGAGEQEMEAFVKACAQWATKMAQYPLPAMSPDTPDAPAAAQPGAAEAPAQEPVPER